MAFQVFGYRDEEPRASGLAIPRPTVDLRVAHGGQEIRVRSLVDTGSPTCVFGRAVAEALDIDMAPNAARDRTMHILGGQHQARVATVSLELPPFDGAAWDAECSFLYADLDVSFAGILGQEGFLDRWVASFNYYDGYFVVESRDDVVARLGVDPVEVIQGTLDSEWDRPTVF